MATLGAAASWLVVNLPVMVFAPEGWKKFYTFSQERSVDFGSFWLVITQRTGEPIEVSTVNTVSTLATIGLCAAIGALTLMAPRFYRASPSSRSSSSRCSSSSTRSTHRSTSCG